MKTDRSFLARLLQMSMFAAAANLAATAAVIDVFSVPQAAERTTVGSTLVKAPAVELSDSLFERRTLTVSFGVQRLEVAAGKLTFEVFQPNVGFPANVLGYPAISYQSTAPVNLLASGATAIRLIFESFSSREPYFFALYVGNGTNLQQVDLEAVGNGLDGPVVVDIPFARFNRVDLHAVSEVRIDGGRMPVGTKFVISSIQTVPEPAAIQLIALAAGCLVVRRRQ